MRSRLTVVLGIGLLVLAAGCATSTEWQEWRDHTTHSGLSHRHRSRPDGELVGEGDHREP